MKIHIFLENSTWRSGGWNTNYTYYERDENSNVQWFLHWFSKVEFYLEKKIRSDWKINNLQRSLNSDLFYPSNILHLCCNYEWNKKNRTYKLIEDNWAAKRTRMRRVGENAVVNARQPEEISNRIRGPGFAESRRVDLWTHASNFFPFPSSFVFSNLLNDLEEWERKNNSMYY